ncbi:MAG: HDOD domain-containing protein [Chitinispirillaceae bacterium]|nr:HDOD domain-containing protein [Chitinispirillaceae bacterium]
MPISEQLRDRIEHFANLPTLPQVATRLMSIINNPLTSSSDVAFVVGQDLSLSAKVLRLANSAFYGIPRSITSINNAVVILGLKVINTMVLSLTVFDMFPDDKQTSALFDRKSFWLHSLSCGLIAKFLATRIRKVILFDPEEAFCAGLLHDIGKVVMEQYLHDDFHDALEHATINKIPIYQAENSTLGYSHTDIAEWLTTSWSLPSEIRLSLMYHHDPQRSVQSQDIISLCHLADWLCYKTGMVISGDYEAPELDENAMQLLKLLPEDIEAIKELLPVELEKTSIFYDVVRNK